MLLCVLPQLTTSGGSRTVRRPEASRTLNLTLSEGGCHSRRKLPAKTGNRCTLTGPRKCAYYPAPMTVTVKTQTQAPARSLDQRMEALKRANDIRVRRAKLKKDLKDGQVQIEQILTDPPDYVSTAKVFDILMAVPKFGRVKAARFLNQCRISQAKTVGGLSERQRAELIGLFHR